jgi:hypothetical protein
VGTSVIGNEDLMNLGPNIKSAGAWALAFVVAQGLIYRWGYDVGYLTGQRQGYGDFFEERHSKARSEEMAREDQVAHATAPTTERDALMTTTTGQESPTP